ncbi:MAG: 30S ribosomal protein S19e [Candidatus Bathyarchaeota archaeon]|jgi:small subunit ribosomal protein S19e|nr:30S ribosomal protein S19e [Candidatus Bathyarchaeota archaeon]UCD39870.1 MAG: 30S ribosomal protein S19e [Candidatus Bathyarchaeota archaeon]
MPTPYDVPANLLIQRLAQYLKDEVDQIRPPAWASVVKTSSHVQRTPQNADWWFTRCASVLRKIYLRGPLGIQRLRAEYGGRKDRGVRPEHTRKGSGAIIRKTLQQLEEAKLTRSSGNQGRVVTKQGRSLLDHLSTEIKKELEKQLPELKKY